MPAAASCASPVSKASMYSGFAFGKMARTILTARSIGILRCVLKCIGTYLKLSSPATGSCSARPQRLRSRRCRPLLLYRAGHGRHIMLDEEGIEDDERQRAD